MASDYRTNNAVAWTLTALSLGFIVSRLGWRGYTRNLGLDDIVILISLCILVSFSALFTATYAPGISSVRAAVLTFATETSTFLAVSAPKLAVTLLLARIFNIKLWQKRLLISLAVSCLLLGIAIGIWVWFPCDPPAAAFDPEAHPNAHCASPSHTANASYFFGSYSAFLDLLFGVFPAVQFWSMQMPLRRKVVLSVMLALGVTASAVGFYKVHFIASVSKNRTSSVSLLLWTNIEANLMNTAACVPTLPKFALFVLEKLRSMPSYLRSSVLKGQSRLSRHNAYHTTPSEPQVSPNNRADTRQDVEMQRLTASGAASEANNFILRRVDIETTASKSDEW